MSRRLALDRWFPHVPIALATAPLGVVMLELASSRIFRIPLHALHMSEIEGRADLLQSAPLLEGALGVSLVTISLGLMARSRLAWLLAVGSVLTAIGLNLPPKTAEVPLIAYCVGLLTVLVLYRRHFQSHNAATAGVFAAAVALSFLLWGTLGTLRLGAQFEPRILTLTDAFYFTLVAVTSVGFGDITPKTPEARLFVAALIFTGVVVGATALSTVLAPVIGNHVRRIMGGTVRMDRSNHYVIVGTSSLARNTATELESRGQRVTLVLGEAPNEDFYKRRDVVVGDATDLSVLRDAGSERAKGVLALSLDDATNGFVVLGVNEIDPTIPTVAALNDPKNEFRLKRVQPSMMLSLQALGGELLAMALTGEHVEVDMLRKALQIHSDEPELRDKR